jgi:hypothetical protein
MSASSSEHSSELLRRVLRHVASAMLAMGLFTLLSGGVNIVSSLLVIAMGGQWLVATASRGSLQEHLEELALLREKDCVGCCRNCCSGMCSGVFDNIRGLAVAAIVFGVFELIGYVGPFGGLGYALTSYGYPTLSPGSSTYNVNTRTYECYTGSNTYCTIYYYPSYTYQSFSFKCYSGTPGTYCSAMLPDYITQQYGPYIYNYFYDSTDSAIGKWLLFAAGHAAVAAPLNIAWGAITLNLIGVLTAMAPSAGDPSAGETTALLSRKSPAPTFIVTGDAKQPEF